MQDNASMLPYKGMRKLACNQVIASTGVIAVDTGRGSFHASVTPRSICCKIVIACSLQKGFCRFLDACLVI